MTHKQALHLMSLTNLRHVSTIAGTLRGMRVEFQWEQVNGYVLPMKILDAESRKPLEIELTAEEQATLNHAIETAGMG